MAVTLSSSAPQTIDHQRQSSFLDVFVRDLISNTTTLASANVTSSGGGSGDVTTAHVAWKHTRGLTFERATTLYALRENR